MIGGDRHEDLAARIQPDEGEAAAPGLEHQGWIGEAGVPAGIAPGIFEARGQQHAATAVKRARQRAGAAGIGQLLDIAVNHDAATGLITIARHRTNSSGSAAASSGCTFAGNTKAAPIPGRPVEQCAKPAVR